MTLSILYAYLFTLMLPLSGSGTLISQKTPVSIGLLVPDSSYIKVVEAAEQALAESNERGGFNGRAFELVVRTTEGPWGAGSKESVGLVYEDEVRAFLGSLDGRNAHLAEQVAAKSHLVYLETHSSDPTLSQAYVPWFLRNIPNDNQQAEAILKLIGEEGAAKTAVLTNEAYDVRYAVKSLREMWSKSYGISPLIVALDSRDSGIKETGIQAAVEQLTEAGSEHLIIPLHSASTLQIIADVKRQLPSVKIYGTLAFCRSLDPQTWKSGSLEGIFLVHSYQGPKEKRLPDPEKMTASYAYDGMRLIVEAILQAGEDREAIRNYLLEADHPKGLTGPIEFDQMGNRKGAIQFVQILNGVPVPLD